MSNEITINNEIYIKKSSVEGNYKPSPVRIAVLNRGWVVVGRVKEEKNKTFITNASVIRRWGTTEGLGELAYNGELNDTVLDTCPDIEVETANIVLLMNCNEENWKNV
jgi:hypothetical protein